jgi:hypothetical protein
MGPVGSSKSSTCWMELFSRACEQRPNKKGERRTRGGILRNTYPELKSTTIKTVLEWAPFMQMKWDSPITGTINLPLPDGTRLINETIFLALERPEEIDKIGSLELTFGWGNEVREIAKAVIDKLSERVGRFPPTKWEGGEPRCKHVLVGDACGVCGALRTEGPTWRGIVLDTNPPDVDHWYYKIAEKADPEIVEQTKQAEEELRKMGFLKPGEPLIQFFRQPGGLVLTPSGYEQNPNAENIPHLDGGYAYYFRQMAGKSKEWIKAQILGEYATLVTGKAVYPEYSDEIHCNKEEIRPIEKLPLLIGFDYGLTPAAVICQLTPRGQLLVLDELTSNGMGIRQFARDALKPHIANFYRQWQGNIQCVGDPAGMRKSDTDERTCFMELADEGFICMPALSNDQLARLEAVKKFLTKMTDGKPGILVSPKAIKIRQGFLGKYFYERVQVTGKDIYRDKPCKNDYSHPHDALQYVSMYVNHVELSSWKEEMGKPRVAMI